MQNSRKIAIDLYGHTLWEAFLSKFKFWEEPYETVNKMLPNQGKIIDLGCGEGLLSNYLAITSPKRKVVGYEIAPERLMHAKKGIKNVSFSTGDIVRITYPKADAIVLFHVLHHLSDKNTQEHVLKKVKNALKNNGKLVIAEVHVKPNIKFIAAWIADHFLVPWVFEKKLYTKAYFRKEGEWVSVLKKIGFKVKTTEETNGRPFPNIIFECKLR